MASQRDGVKPLNRLELLLQYKLPDFDKAETYAKMEAEVCMPYEVLEKEIKTLSETDLAEVSDFIVYLKLKERFADFENQKKLDIEKKLDEADSQAASTEARLTHEEVFSGIRSKIKAG